MYLQRDVYMCMYYGWLFNIFEYIAYMHMYIEVIHMITDSLIHAHVMIFETIFRSISFRNVEK